MDLPVAGLPPSHGLTGLHQQATNWGRSAGAVVRRGSWGKPRIRQGPKDKVLWLVGAQKYEFYGFLWLLNYKHDHSGYMAEKSPN